VRFLKYYKERRGGGKIAKVPNVCRRRGSVQKKTLGEKNKVGKLRQGSRGVTERASSSWQNKKRGIDVKKIGEEGEEKGNAIADRDVQPGEGQGQATISNWIELLKGGTGSQKE